MTRAGERNSNNLIEIVLLGRTLAAAAGLARQIEVLRPCIMKQYAASPATALHSLATVAVKVWQRLMFIRR